MATQQIILDFKGLPPEIYCPACGVPVCSEKAENKPCKHVCLIRLDIAPDTEWLMDGLKERWEGWVRNKAISEGVALGEACSLEDYASELDWDDLFESLCNIVESPSAFGLQITTSSGPCSGTMLVVFDFDPVS